MAPPIIGIPSWRADCTFTAPGASAPGYPVTHLGLTPQAKVWRSASLNTIDTRFVGTFSDTRKLGLIALLRHNLTKYATYRVRTFFDALRTELVYDSGFLPVLPEVYDEDDPEADWDSGNLWDATYTDEELVGTRLNRPLLIPDNPAAHAFEVEIVDLNNPAGYVEAGLCEPATARQFPIGVSFGSGYGFMSRSLVSEADGGVEYYEERDKPRLFQGELSHVSRETALSLFYELQRQQDVSKSFFFWLDPDDDLQLLRTAYLARLQQLDLITIAATAHDRIPLSIKEVL
ncbi:hypothetical protein JL101_036010 (plasmid) [Skermanella rosea]|uniref:hypothetical protein n=1 Tax=Skermanella rosea TaxID=1817965 RepID=UPI001933797C|nr:hypothetical protein [Skermanella rosea]UEM08059.1 hypothetical protein JL101_036010 [Skermanella rosea]